MTKDARSLARVRTFATTDLCDTVEGIAVCETQFRQFGRRYAFHGDIVTVRCHEDNALLRQVIEQPGTGRVLVVDGGGSVRCALMGDLMASIVVASGWKGGIINGAVRDVDALGALDIGLKALGSNPQRSAKTGEGERDVAVWFGNARFAPGAQVFSDEDGIVVLRD